jgi:hypothetical protein
MGWVRTGIGQRLQSRINDCVPAPARLRRWRRGARAGAAISADGQADLACQCWYVYEGGAGENEGLGLLRSRTPRRRLPIAARQDSQTDGRTTRAEARQGSGTVGAR